MKKGYVYILTNKTNDVLYVGVTSDLYRRIEQHKNHVIKGFTEKYNVTKLVYVEEYALVKDAIRREKQLKGWTHLKKLNLIMEQNHEFTELKL